MRYCSAVSQSSFLLILLGATAASADVVDKQSNTLIVKYPDGRTERVIVEYAAELDEQRRTIGRSSPFGGDNRRCDFTVNSAVKRQTYLVTETGAKAPLAAFSKQFSDANFGLVNTRNIIRGSCASISPFIDSRVSAATAAARNALPGIVAADQRELRQAIKQQLNGTAIGTPDELANLQKAIDDFIAALKQAALAYSVPKNVQVADSFEVTATMSFDKSLAELKSDIETGGRSRGRGHPSRTGDGSDPFAVGGFSRHGRWRQHTRVGIQRCGNLGVERECQR